MSEFWSWFVIIIVASNIIGSVILLWVTRKTDGSGGENETTGHVYDGIEEYNNPLPAWWLGLFYITIVFGVVYLFLYPGLGNYQGSKGWSQVQQWKEEVAEAEEHYAPIFAQYKETPIPELIKNEDALRIGQRLFANNCYQCHGSDGGGLPGFPNLRDNDWLYGGAPENIKQTLLYGRRGMMPALGAALGDEGVTNVSHYVLSLSGRGGDAEKVEKGKVIWNQQCFACHGMDGKGNIALGAPNLTDNVWLYGGSLDLIKDTIYHGRAGVMPAQKELLGEDKIHILAAYVYSLSKDNAKTQ